MSSFGRSILILASGTVIAQAIPIAIMPVLTRVYMPSEFATLSSFTAVVSVLGTIVAGRYEMAIMHASSAEEANEVAALSFLITLVVGGLIGGVAAYFSEAIAVLLGQPSLAEWLCWLSVPLIATGGIQTFSTLLNWHKNYKAISSGRVIQNLLSAVTSCGLGFNKILGGMLFGYVIGLIGGAFFFWRKIGSVSFRVSRERLSVQMKKYAHYPLYSAPAALLDVASMNACIFILGHYYSQGALGQFSLTHRLLLIPMALVGVSVAQAFFQHASETRRNGDSVYVLMRRTTWKLLSYSLPAFLIFAVTAPQIFSWIFGAGWREAGEYAGIIALAYWVRLGVSPVSSVFMVVNRLKLGTAWQVAYFCTSFSVLGAGAGLHFSVQKFLLLYAVHEAFLYGFYYWLARYACLQDK